MHGGTNDLCVEELSAANVLLTVQGVLGTVPSVRAIGYVRVSTERQADWGVSLEAQTEKSARWRSVGRSVPGRDR